MGNVPGCSLSQVPSKNWKDEEWEKFGIKVKEPKDREKFTSAVFPEGWSCKEVGNYNVHYIDDKGDVAIVCWQKTESHDVDAFVSSYPSEEEKLKFREEKQRKEEREKKEKEEENKVPEKAKSAINNFKQIHHMSGSMGDSFFAGREESRKDMINHHKGEFREKYESLSESEKKYVDEKLINSYGENNVKHLYKTMWIYMKE
jgi:hypothetical protein